ncbi:hypothetical protein PANDA_001996, partial [Ailuropoda melanoleuca]
AHKHKKQDVLQPCDTEYPVFVHQTAIQETNGVIECGGCQKVFVMQQIPSSNLLLLVTDPTCDCSIFPLVLQEATEVKYILPISRILNSAHNASVKCDRMRSQKLRRRPDPCHAFHPEARAGGGHRGYPFISALGSQENAQECGGTSDTSASLPMLLLPACAWVLPPQLLR